VSVHQRALADYWNLRDEGLSADDASAHVRQRFGVVIDQSILPPADVVAWEELSEDIFLGPPLRERPITEPLNLSWGQDFCKTSHGCYDGGRRS
jgi:hypothetical protein